MDLEPEEPEAPFASVAAGADTRRPEFEFPTPKAPAIEEPDIQPGFLKTSIEDDDDEDGLNGFAKDENASVKPEDAETNGALSAPTDGVNMEVEEEPSAFQAKVR
jgi:hypothetical protein